MFTANLLTQTFVFWWWIFHLRWPGSPWKLWLCPNSLSLCERIIYFRDGKKISPRKWMKHLTGIVGQSGRTQSGVTSSYYRRFPASDNQSWKDRQIRKETIFHILTMEKSTRRNLSKEYSGLCLKDNTLISLWLGNWLRVHYKRWGRVKRAEFFLKADMRGQHALCERNV